MNQYIRLESIQIVQYSQYQLQNAQIYGNMKFHNKLIKHKNQRFLMLTFTNLIFSQLSIDLTEFYFIQFALLPEGLHQLFFQTLECYYLFKIFLYQKVLNLLLEKRFDHFLPKFYWFCLTLILKVAGMCSSFFLDRIRLLKTMYGYHLLEIFEYLCQQSNLYV